MNVNSDEHRRWLECRCDTCKRLDAVAHSKLCWSELFEAKKHECPNYSDAIYNDVPDEKQLDMFGGQL